ncbi:MAG: glycerol-3-phosphate acyltransferase, partial [Anaerolineae bacterium]|nr:glycerol-3-phosphate acyltransferase [Anaerolineae bacterium]
PVTASRRKAMAHQRAFYHFALRLTGNEEEAEDLALTLRSGALPARVTYLEERTVGPSLGADSIRQGFAASIAGLAAIVGHAYSLYFYLKEGRFSRGKSVATGLGVVVGLVAAVAAAAAEPVYVGARVCGTCHAGPGMGYQFSLWLNSKHSQAYAVLARPEAKKIAQLSGIRQDPQETFTCLGCHSTGAHAEAWQKEETFRVEDGVQCETCHGPGSEYMAEAVMRDREAARAAGLQMPGEAFCMKCHIVKGTHVAVLGSPRLTNEAAYLLTRLARALGTGNVDFRLGAPAPAPAQATLPDLRQAEVILLFQGDPSEEAPILELWVKQAVKRGGRLYIVHPRALLLDRYAAGVYRPRPGSEAVLIAGILSALEEARAGSLPAEWREAVSSLGPTQVASLTGCDREAVRVLGEALVGSSRAVIAYGAGVRDEETLALLAALAKATGARLLGWNGGPNSRGVADMGLLPDRLPGRAPLGDAAVAAALERLWQAPLSCQAGLSATELWSAMRRGEVRALYVAGADPVTAAPNPQLVEEALAHAAFVALQEAFLTPTAERFAHVVLPAAVPGEEDGSLTNLAGGVGWQQALIAPIGEARPNWQIVADVAMALSAPGSWEYADAAQVLAEIAQAIPAYAGVEAVRTGGYFDARYEYALTETPPAAPAPAKVAGSGDLALTTGPVLFDRDIMARHAPGVAGRAPEAYAAIHPGDAERLGITDGASIEVRGLFGALTLKARVSGACAQGTVFVPEELSELSVNRLGAQPGVVVMVEVKPLAVRPD